jgi:hypothetical protein
LAVVVLLEEFLVELGALFAGDEYDLPPLEALDVLADLDTETL